MKLLNIKETNLFANPSLANNGGGYSQPLITFEYEGDIITIHDTSCGEFGKRYKVIIGEKYFSYDGVSRDMLDVHRYSTNFEEVDRNFIDKFNYCYPEYRILTIEELEEEFS
ncbi:MAG: hypothetical protein M0Q88_02845 [Bacilli bacterium]|nr:hypothetical protein [Bacilli bacterium]